MAELTDTQIDEALARGAAARRTEPRATAARYDRRAGRVIVELSNGCTFAFPARLAQGLERATDEQLAEVEVLGTGTGLHWEALDADLSVPGLLAGLFGTRAFMAGQADEPRRSRKRRRREPMAPAEGAPGNPHEAGMLIPLGEWGRGQGA